MPQFTVVEKKLNLRWLDSPRYSSLTRSSLTSWQYSTNHLPPHPRKPICWTYPNKNGMKLLCSK